jgi:FkbM family methyltransferase
MRDFLKFIAARLPSSTQQELKRRRYAREIRTGRFVSDEPEFAVLDTFVGPGDWALDIGANIGSYTARLSELVGPAGRVIAFEPMAETFELLAANSRCFRHRNVTLLNAAASDACAVLDMELPSFSSGLANFYQARLTESATGLSVLCLPVDSLPLPRRIALAKIDAEGHEGAVLRGMRRVLERDRPVLIVEASKGEAEAFLPTLGYRAERLPDSSNRVFRHPESRARA